MDRETLEIHNALVTFENKLLVQARLSTDVPYEPKWVAGALILFARLGVAVRETLKEVTKDGGT